MLAQWSQIPLIATHEVVGLALDDGTHRVEQCLLSLLEHLDKHAGALIGILYLFFLLILLDGQCAGAAVTLVHQGIAFADLQCGDIVAQCHCHAFCLLIQFHIKVGRDLVAGVRT